MTALSFRAVVARIPGIAWVILFAITLNLVALWFAYGRGRQAGAVTVHRAALQDSARVAHAHVDTAAKLTDGRVVMATRWRAKSSSAQARYAAQRAAIGAALDSAPVPVIALVRSADTVIAQLDTTVHVQAAALAAFALEREARIAADSVEAHQIALRPPDRGPDVVKVAAVVTAIALIVSSVVR